MRELYLPPENYGCDPRTGRYVKGHQAWSKGKRLDRVPQENRERMLANLNRRGNIDCKPRNKRPVVYLKHGGGIVLFPSAKEAAEATGAMAAEITKCCRGKARSAAGLTWMYYEDFNRIAL